MKRWITQAEYAVKFKLNRSSVSRAVKAGRIHRRTSDGKVDGSIDIRSTRAAAAEDKDLLQLQKEKLQVQIDAGRLKNRDELEKIRQAAILEFMGHLHGKYEYLRKRMAELGLTEDQAEKMRAILTEYEEGLRA